MKYTKDHTQYFNTKNEEVPSVTTILKILNKPALVKWANHLGFNCTKVDDVLKETSIVGTLVHEVVNSLIRKADYIYIKDNEKPPLGYITGHIKSFLAWYNTNRIEPILLEKSLSCDEFGGTLDFYGKVNGKLTIIDFKTAKKIRLSMFFQLAMYCILLEKHGYKVEQTGIVLCNPDHRDVRYISREDLQEYIDLSELLIELFHKYYTINEKNKWGEGLT